MRQALIDVALAAHRRLDLAHSNVILDIGSNDGTLLSLFSDAFQTVGFEPARIPSGIQGNLIIRDYFSAKAYLALGIPKAHLITSLAMFYDIDEPHAFVNDIHECLAEDGVWVNQMNYLGLMVKNTAFDNICHEHLTYWNLAPFCALLAAHGLEVFDVEVNEVNGGSIRTYVCHKGKRTITEAVSNLLAQESSQDPRELRVLLRVFAWTVKTRKREMLRTLQEIPGRVYLLGASTRGNTLIQYYGLDVPVVQAAVERNPEKVGRLIPGTSIPIIGEEEARKNNPSAMIVLPWYYKAEIVKRERAYLEHGGTLLFPLPEVHVECHPVEVKR